MISKRVTYYRDPKEVLLRKPPIIVKRESLIAITSRRKQPENTRTIKA